MLYEIRNGHYVRHKPNGFRVMGRKKSDHIVAVLTYTMPLMEVYIGRYPTIEEATRAAEIELKRSSAI